VSSSATISSKAPQLEPASQELLEALDGLKKTAANYVNLSRLQLALQGVEAGQKARVRVAGTWSGIGWSSHASLLYSLNGMVEGMC
jgi:hypothetical protein